MFTKVDCIALCLSLAFVFCWCGCSGEGRLELELGRDDNNLATQAVVRVDGEVYDTFDLSETAPPIELAAGGHIVGVDFLDASDNVVGSYAPAVVEIEDGRTTRLFIGNRTPPAPVGHFNVPDTVFELSEVKLIPVNASGTILRREEGRGTTTFGLLSFKDDAGNTTGVLRISAEYLVKDARWELDPADGVFKGNESGLFIMYLGDIAEGNVIFEGDFLTDPPNNLRAVVQPNGTLVSFELTVFLEATGKGIYQGHTLRGTSRVECFRTPAGDTCFISMSADIVAQP